MACARHAFGAEHTPPKHARLKAADKMAVHLWSCRAECDRRWAGFFSAAHLWSLHGIMLAGTGECSCKLLREQDVHVQIGFLGPALFLSQLSHVKTATGAVACMMASQGLDSFSQSGLYSNHQVCCKIVWPFMHAYLPSQLLTYFWSTCCIQTILKLTVMVAAQHDIRQVSTMANMLVRLTSLSGKPAPNSSVMDS